MKATLKFNFDDQEDKKEYLRCIKSSEMADIIFDLQHNFIRKYKDKEVIDIEIIIEDINNLIGNFDIDELI